eukprot:15481734-Alexandrium_andersonii.AAC.1
MARVAAADPGADDLAVPLLAADASSQDLMVAAAHELQPADDAGVAAGARFLFCGASASAT